MASIMLTRPADPDDYAGWQKYHEAQAERIAQEAPPAEMMARVGQLQGEMDHRVEAQIYQRIQEQRQYDAAMASIRDDARSWQQTHLAGHEPQKTLAGLQTIHRYEQAQIGARAEFAASQGANEWLSNDDRMLAYRQGANAALTESYWAQKRENGFGNSKSVEAQYIESYEAGRNFAALGTRLDAPPHSLSLEEFSRGIGDYRKEHGVPEITKDVEQNHQPGAAAMAEAKAIIDNHIGARAAELEREWRAIEAPSAIAAGAATNYFRGRAEEWNSLREVLMERHPDLAKDLPAAIQVDEIQVRQRVLEQEQSQENRLALAR